jgi:hypothetical protein
MGSGSITVVHRGVEHPVELLLLQDEQVIETLAPYTAEKAFTDGIGSRGVIRRFESLDATRVGNPSEARSKFAIVIPDEIFRPLSKGCNLPQLLCGPGVGRISWKSVDADVDHLPRAQFDDEESEERMEKKVGDRETRHRPRFAQHECAGRSPSSDPLVESCAPVAYISGWFVCRRVDPA